MKVLILPDPVGTRVVMDACASYSYVAASKAVQFVFFSGTPYTVSFSVSNQVGANIFMSDIDQFLAGTGTLYDFSTIFIRPVILFQIPNPDSAGHSNTDPLNTGIWATAGSTVYLYGYGFKSGAIVSIDGVDVATTFYAFDALSFPSGAGAGGHKVALKVRNTDGTSFEVDGVYGW